MDNNQQKQTFQGITKMTNSNFKKLRSSSICPINNENINNSNSKVTNEVNTSYVLKNSKKEESNKSFYENINLKDRSYSPITHRRNQQVENFMKEKHSAIQLHNQSKDQEHIKLNHFEEFNVNINNFLFLKL